MTDDHTGDDPDTPPLEILERAVARLDPEERARAREALEEVQVQKQAAEFGCQWWEAHLRGKADECECGAIEEPEDRENDDDIDLPF